MVSKAGNLLGFTHYVADEADDGAWLYSDEGLEMFKMAQEHKLIASIHCRPQHQQHIRELANRVQLGQLFRNSVQKRVNFSWHLIILMLIAPAI